ncbi:hypothetical protein K1719_038953 [Acacia pycnantha]|nr:hypothetical protein K1719_038953 [Acacia pycnantha]
MGASISFLRNSMSSVLLDLDPASIHTIYAYLTGLLLALVELKYQALNTSPFNDHPALMLLFLIAITLYVMALLVLRSNRQINAITIWVCHICGSLACEMLLLLLVSPCGASSSISLHFSCFSHSSSPTMSSSNHPGVRRDKLLK